MRRRAVPALYHGRDGRGTHGQDARATSLQHRSETGGLVCRKCGCRHFFVVYTPPIPAGIRRRRQCRHCGHRIATTERG